MCICCLFLIGCVTGRFAASSLNSPSLKPAIISPTSVCEACEEVKCRFFLSLLSTGGVGGWKQRDVGVGGVGWVFDDWQTFRSHASLVVIKNKHTEQGRKHIPPELGQIQASQEKRELWPFRLSTLTNQHNSKQLAWQLHSKLDKT